MKTTIFGSGAKRGVRAASMTLALMLGAVTLTACASPQAPQVTPTTTVTPDAQPDKSAVPVPEEALTWPLTGVALDEEASGPAVAVKIENTSAARPQFGLERADVVWETIVEFDVSRFVAVYHSDIPDEVGPVRSVRPMDMAIAAPLNGLFVYSGGQAGILRDLRAEDQMQGLDENSGASGMWRSTARFAPHNLHANLETMTTLADDSHSAPPAEQFAFAENLEDASAVAKGTAATNLDLRMSSASNPNWDWDKASQTWLRSEGTVPAMAASGDQIGATNVVLIQARHYDSGYRAQNNAAVPTYELTGTGEATIATGGKTLKATWSKADAQAPMVLLDSKGLPLTLAPGNTWVELVPLATGSITIN